MKLFQEYINEKGKLLEPSETVSGDTRLVPPRMPEKSPDGLPYRAKGVKKKKEKLGEMGLPGLGYDELRIKAEVPKTKIPMAEQAELASLVCKAIHKEVTFCETLVYMLKNTGSLAPVLAEMLRHEDTYKVLNEIVNHEKYGQEFAQRMQLVLNEETSSPLHRDLDMDREEVEYEGPEFDDEDVEDEDEMEGEEDLDMEDDEGVEDEDMEDMRMGDMEDEDEDEDMEDEY